MRKYLQCNLMNAKEIKLLERNLSFNLQNNSDNLLKKYL